MLSIPEHARDAEEVLKAAGFNKADVVVNYFFFFLLSFAKRTQKITIK